MGLDHYSSLFRRFALKECVGVSELYAQLAQQISEDVELLEISKYARARQPIPNLFLAAVQFLLLKNPESDLSHYYPSISKNSSEGIPFSLFKAFSQKYKSEIIHILKTRIVQTNAINRTAVLMPILSSLPYKKG